MTGNARDESFWENPIFAGSLPATTSEVLEDQWDEIAVQPAPAATLDTLEQVSEDNSVEDVRRQPILATFGPEISTQFVWAVTTDTIETYEHRDTLRFLHIDSVTGECLNQSCEVISREMALQHALRPVTKAVAEPAGTAGRGSVDAPGTMEFEPKLNGFTRKIQQAGNGAEEVTLTDEAFQLPVFSGLNKFLTQTKRLGRVLHWNDPLASKTPDLGSKHPQSTQEPNLATFTRRTSAL